jgi:hypothetical protein
MLALYSQLRLDVKAQPKISAFIVSAFSFVTSMHCARRHALLWTQAAGAEPKQIQKNRLQIVERRRFEQRLLFRGVEG